MKKYIFIIILSIGFCIVFYADNANAATEFVSTIRASGGDYSLLSSWEAAVQCDLTASTTSVYSGTGTGSLSSGYTVELFRGGVYQEITAAVVATTSSQILVQGFSGASIVLQDADEWRLASSTTNMWTVSSAGLGDTAIAVAECYNDWPSGLSDNVTIDGWTTNSTNYVKIYAPEGERHDGWTWTNTSKTTYSGFALKSNAKEAIDNNESYTRIMGLVIDLNQIYDGHIEGGILDHCIIFNCASNSSNNCSVYVSQVYNSLIYDMRQGLSVYGSCYWYNNTVYLYTSTSYAYLLNGVASHHHYLKNNLAGRGIFRFSGGNHHVNNCASVDASADDAGGTGNRVSQTFTFVNEANDNFHLASSDSGARNQGTDLSSDANYPITNDIDYATRPGGGIWDIGADEVTEEHVAKINSPLTNKWTNGLVGYWSFNGQNMDWASSTAEALDRSGNSNNGDVIGAKPVPGKVGQGLEFDGVDDYVDADQVFDGVGDFSFSCWFKADTMASLYADLISEREDSANNQGNQLILTRFDNHKLQIKIRNLAGSIYSLTTASSYDDNSWHYSVFQRSGSNLIINVDGGSEIVTLSGVTTDDVVRSTNRTRIGAFVNSSNYFPGIIDEVRIYNRALSASEIAEQYRAGARRLKANTPMSENFLSSGLVGYWSFNGQDMDWGSSTAEASDRSGQGNNGNVVGAKPVSGKVGQGLEFDGVDDYVDIGSGSSLSNLGPLTWEAWIYPSTVGENGGGRILDKAQKRLFLENDLSRNIAFGVSGASILYRYTTSNAFDFGTWSHVAVAWDGTNDLTKIHIYVNGAECSYAGGANGSSPNDDSTNDLIIGNTIGTDKTFDGIIDEVRIYNRALSESEIQQLYRAGARKMRL